MPDQPSAEPLNTPPTQPPATLIIVPPPGPLAPRHVNRIGAARKEDSYAPCLKIKRIRGGELEPEPLMVPMDTAANQNREIIVSELARQFLTEVLDHWKDKGTKLTPLELKQTMEAINIANDNCRFAHAGIALPPEKPSGGTGKGADLANAMFGLGAGIAAGKTPEAEELLKKFRSLGAKLQKAEAKEGEVTEIKS
jgi:hypothetical protein